MNETYEKGGRLLLLNFALGLGTFIQVLDSSIANVAIPYIAGNLGVSVDQGTWVITSFAASNAVVLPLTGWLANYFGRVHLFVWSVLLFALFSFLCGFSTSLPMLVIFRVIQGAVAGSLIPLSQTLMMEHNSPQNKGAALGFWGMVVIVAPVVGPILGGYLTEEYSWPWIFYINVPIGIFSALTVWSFLKNKESKKNRVPIDWIGLILLATGVACLQIMLDKGKDLDWFDSHVIVALTIISAISLLYFGFWTYYQQHPIVDFSFFRNRNFALGTIVMTVGYSIYFGSTVTVPLWLQTEMGYTAYWAGVAVAPIGIVPLFLLTTIGRNLHRFDLRFLVALSFFLFSLGFFHQASFTSDVSLEVVMLMRFYQGFGLCIFFLPLVQLTLGQLSKERYASGSGVFNFVRILFGSGFGTSLAITFWTRLEIFHYQRLGESITAYRDLVVKYYGYVMSLNPLYTPNVTTELVNYLVEQQAFMLATNDLAWLAAWMFIVMIPFIFLCERVKKA